MKFLILNTDYSKFLHWLYAQHPGLEAQIYEKQLQMRNESLFGVADFYSSNLCRLGHEAREIHANNEFLQRGWAREHALEVEEPGSSRNQWRKALEKVKPLAARPPLRHVKRFLRPLLRPVLRLLTAEPTWFYEILSFQIKHYKPDVLLNQDMSSIGGRFLREMKPYVRLLVGQIASPLPEKEDFGCYDLVISSLPNLVKHFRGLGIPAALNRFAFEPRILKRLNHTDQPIPVSFVGSLSWHHESRVRLLEHLCSPLQIKVWGQGVEGLSSDSPIRRCHMGNAWGNEMYQILHQSKITLNHHIGVAESYANNMRLFEATGAGTMLATDWKDNLHEMFEVGKEVVAYRSGEECAELIRYYLEHEDERQVIAHAGQERTLRDHTYYNRMQELVEIVQKCL